VLSATHYGTAWTIGSAALLAFALSLAVPVGRGLAQPLALAVFLYSRSMVSHAAAGGDFGWAVAADWLHLVFISAWVGEVLAAGLAALRVEPGDPQSRLECGAYVRTLSRSATLALAGLFATGAFSAWRGLGTIENAVGNPYATTLLLKLALVLGAATLGGMNRFVLMPALLKQLRQPGPAQGAAGRFTRVLHIEAVLLVAALVVAAFLSSTSPPTAS
jgi:putative copper resistance protein D